MFQGEVTSIFIINSTLQKYSDLKSGINQDEDHTSNTVQTSLDQSLRLESAG